MISEPMTLVTDYVLGMVTAVLGIRLYLSGRKRGSISSRLWAGAFMATSLASFFGGSYHGFSLRLGVTTSEWLWMATLYTIALVGFFMLSGSLVATACSPLRNVALLIAALKMLLAFVLLASHPEFRLVIYDYASAMLVVFGLHCFPLGRRSPPGKWMIAGVLASFAAAGIQQSGFSLHQHFNNNDMYHVIQMIAALLFYRGGVLLEDRQKNTHAHRAHKANRKT